MDVMPSMIFASSPMIEGPSLTCRYVRHPPEIGFESEDQWFEYRLENDPRFLRRIEAARASLRAGRGIRLEDVDSE
jgi:hypothetical protein